MSRAQVCTSGDPADLQTTDAIATEVLRGLKAQYEQDVACSGDDAVAAAYAAKAVAQVDDNLLW